MDNTSNAFEWAETDFFPIAKSTLWHLSGLHCGTYVGW